MALSDVAASDVLAIAGEEGETIEYRTSRASSWSIPFSAFVTRDPVDAFEGARRNVIHVMVSKTSVPTVTLDSDEIRLSNPRIGRETAIYRVVDAFDRPGFWDLEAIQ